MEIIFLFYIQYQRDEDLLDLYLMVSVTSKQKQVGYISPSSVPDL